MFEKFKDKIKHSKFLNIINLRNKEANAIASISDTDKQILINNLALNKNIKQLEKENSYLEIENKKAKIIAEKEHQLKELQLSLEEEKLNSKLHKLNKLKRKWFRKKRYLILIIFIIYFIFNGICAITETGPYNPKYHIFTEESSINK